MRPVIMAVLGHVDHGKTTLVKALTGTETDTLPEEKERGLTIALGFAACDLPGGPLYLIDAPGHASFLGTSVAGLSGADAVLLVVSAVEGPQAQTRQHIEIARLMGVRTVITVISQQDLATPVQRRASEAAVAELLGNHDYGQAEICPVSASDPKGLDHLKAVLTAMLKHLPPAQGPAGPYLTIDRVFSQKGAGTIVTGSLQGGPLSRDQACKVEPQGLPVQIRGLQIRGETVDHAVAGSRVAINLRGQTGEDIQRGQVISAMGIGASSQRFDVRIARQKGSRTPLRHMEQVQVSHGTTRNTAHVRLYELRPADADGPQYAQLVFNSPQIAYRGQPFILLRQSATDRLAGGRILDPAAGDHRRQKALQIDVLKAVESRQATQIAAALSVRDRGCVQRAELERLTGQLSEDAVKNLSEQFAPHGPDQLIDRAALNRVQTTCLDQLGRLHATAPLLPELPIGRLRARMRNVPDALWQAALNGLVDTGLMLRQGAHIARADHDPMTRLSDQQHDLMTRLETRLRDGGLQPQAQPRGEDDTETALMTLLARAGRGLRLYNHALKQIVWLHPDSVQQAALTLRRHFSGPAGFTTGEARQCLGTNRKIIVPLLEYLDETGVTSRQGDRRLMEPETPN